MTPLVNCLNLKKYFDTDNGEVKAVDDISFQINSGETIGLVGESGCGKSTVGRTILNLIKPSDGMLKFEGSDIYSLKPKELHQIRRQMGIVFQNPYSALNPRMKILEIVGEPLKTHHKLKGRALRNKVIELLEQVGMKAEHVSRFPHQFSGGQRQRIAIARSLALDPKFLILDEPTSALDVSVQAQVLNLIRKLQLEKNLTYLFITHDLHVVKHIADRILVMYLGKLIEEGPVMQVFESPLHPYTKALIASVPQADPKRRTERKLLEGDVPSPINLPSGCRFHTRCPCMKAECIEKEPVIKKIKNRQVACHLI